MKTYKTIFLIFLTFSTSIYAQQYQTLNIGEELPMKKNQLQNIDNNGMSLQDNFQSNGLLVVFTSNSCPFVVMWENRYKLIEEKCSKHNIGMVYVNSNQARRSGDDSIEKMKEHSKNMNYRFPYLIDKNSILANEFGAKTTPHIFLFNNKMKLVYKGAIDDNYKSIDHVKETYLLDALGQLSDNKTIRVNTTKAVGCSIKRVR
jgi:thioredoxin-related protein